MKSKTKPIPTGKLKDEIIAKVKQDFLLKKLIESNSGIKVNTIDYWLFVNDIKLTNRLICTTISNYLKIPYNELFINLNTPETC